MRLRNKIHLYSSVLFVVLLILINTTIYYVFSQMIISRELDAVKADAERIVRSLQQVSATLSADDLLRAYVPQHGMIRIVTPEQELYPSVTSYSELILQDLPYTYYTEQRTERIDFQSRSYAFSSVPIIWTNGDVVNLQVTESMEQAQHILHTLRNVLIVITMLALIPMVISGRLLGNLIIKPITAMTATIKQIQQSGRYQKLELDTEAKDELHELGSSFNRMMDLLRNNYEKQEQFVSSASHELKTPLTVIESYADLLKRRGLERPDLFTESVEAIHAEAVRMREMTEQLLLLAKHDQQWELHMKEVDLARFVYDTAKTFRNAYGREMIVVGEEQIVVNVDEDQLKQLLFILLDNACKYSEDDVTITIGQHEASPFVRIVDKGMGIPKADLPKVFERFYRVDQARSRKAGGTGLGLPLAKEIADALNAELELESIEGLGTTVTIILQASDEGSVEAAR